MYYIYMKICCLNHSNGTEIWTEAINLYAGSLYFYLRSFLDTVYPDNPPVEWVDKIFTFDDYDQVIDRIISIRARVCVAFISCMGLNAH